MYPSLVIVRSKVLSQHLAKLYLINFLCMTLTMDEWRMQLHET